MKKLYAKFIAASLTGLVAASSAGLAFATEEAPSVDASASFLSKYVWRGYELSNDSFIYGGVTLSMSF